VVHDAHRGGAVLASEIGSGLAGELWMLIAWLVVGGFAVGLASVLVPTYIAEIARQTAAAASARSSSSRSSWASSWLCSTTT
jgi:hypothetical protein